MGQGKGNGRSEEIGEERHTIRKIGTISGDNAIQRDLGEDEDDEEGDRCLDVFRLEAKFASSSYRAGFGLSCVWRVDALKVWRGEIGRSKYWRRSSICRVRKWSVWQERASVNKAKHVPNSILRSSSQYGTNTVAKLYFHTSRPFLADFWYTRVPPSNRNYILQTDEIHHRNPNSAYMV